MGQLPIFNTVNEDNIEVVRIWNGKLAREGAKSAPWDLLCACTRVSKVVTDHDKTPNTIALLISGFLMV